MLVYPGIYTDTHGCWSLVNVCLYRSLTLRSLGGPEATVIDGEGLTTFGILADNHAVVEGFTVRNAGWFEWWGAAICVTDGEVRGNVCTDSYMGITDNPWWYSSRSSEGRGRSVVIAGNTLEGNDTGISVQYGGVVADNSLSGNRVGIGVSRNTLVSGNSISGSEVGVGVNGPMNTSLVGNEISGNIKGVTVRNPSHHASAHYTLDLQSNRVIYNTETNVEVRMWDVDPGPECNMTLGGSVGEANDIFGAPVNLYVETHNVELRLDATYNFWGSVSCTTFVPLFHIHEDVPDTAFVFEPFVDDTHTKIFEECESVPVEQTTWGGIKALFR